MRRLFPFISDVSNMTACSLSFRSAPKYERLSTFIPECAKTVRAYWACSWSSTTLPWSPTILPYNLAACLTIMGVILEYVCDALHNHAQKRLYSAVSITNDTPITVMANVPPATVQILSHDHFANNAEAAANNVEFWPAHIHLTRWTFLRAVVFKSTSSCKSESCWLVVSCESKSSWLLVRKSESCSLLVWRQDCNSMTILRNAFRSSRDFTSSMASA
jgi:hypothetical protein